jgi:hypothetical protein
MAIENYAGLQEALARWLARGDLAGTIPDLVALGEQRLFYGAEDPSYASPPLRLAAMERRTDPAVFATVPGAATVTLPEGFLGALSLGIAGAAALDLVGPGQLARFDGLGRPRVYGFEGDAIRLAPTPDAAYGIELLYYRRFDPLATTPSNWLLGNAPGVYLYAALLEAQPFLMNDARLPVWAAMLAAATGGLMRSEREKRWGGRLRLRPDGATP